jgi:hypothetical protein
MQALKQADDANAETDAVFKKLRRSMNLI